VGAVITRTASGWWLAILLSLPGCGDPTSTEAGMLAVTTATTGPSPDPDGYMVRVDGQALGRLAGVDTVIVPLRETATHTVVLGEVSRNCAVAGDSVRDVPVPRGDTAWVGFAVACTGTTGALRITTIASGAELDPNGYQLSVPGLDQPIALTPNGVYTTVLPSGHYAITLSDNTANCGIADGADREVDILDGLTSDVTFTATCPVAPAAGRGREIAFITDRAPADGQAPNRVYLMNEDGTGLHPLGGAPREFLFGLSWLPDGTRLGLISTPKGDDILAGIVYTMDPQVGVLDGLFAFNGFDVPQWSPDGTTMAFTNNLDIFESGVDQIFLLPVGMPLSSAQAVTSDASNARAPSWSPDGTRLAYVTGGGGPDGLDDRIVIRTLSDATEATIVEFPSIFRIAWSPDGTRFAFYGSPDGNDQQIFTVPAGGGVVTQLTYGPAVNGSPAWSPDGERIAFESSRDGNAEIYVMNADGSNQARLTNNPAGDFSPAWRP
jgi:hypothetical protein